MKFVSIVAFSTLTSAAFTPNHLDRRQKSFVQTHQEHGHLPGGANNPGPGALFQQMMRMFQGESLFSILGSYNQAADANKGNNQNNYHQSNNGGHNH
ncbi:hypothetical protein DSO57_1029063 [Entomophthora muscae]|uniref:Uncharacterized protein n=1 Tax=Entomophthora muscae TaxID=34485 RepID=A0ACC2TZY5_9FUNG|nr:hypothetical protein DSO57_1029063 [Entomophthora muscae]